MIRQARSLFPLVFLLVVFFTAIYLLYEDHAPRDDGSGYISAVERARAAVKLPTKSPLNVEQQILRGELGTAKVTDRYGLVTFDMSAVKSEHPISRLIEEARVKYTKMKSRIETQTTLQEAIDDYAEMTGGVWGPPRGFEEWYNFASSHNSVTLPSLIPQAHLSILPFLAYPGDILRARGESILKKDAVYRLKITREAKSYKVELDGSAANGNRADDMLDLIEPILQYLPQPSPGEPIHQFYFGTHDGPAFQAHWEVYHGSEELAKQGRLWSPTKLAKLEAAQHHTFGWLWQCPPDSPLKLASRDHVLNDDEREEDEFLDGKRHPSFIKDQIASEDYCYNPKLMELHGTLINDKSRASGDMIPLISTCRTLYNVDVLGVPTDAMKQNTAAIPWSGKTVGKVFWRGSLTGAFHNSWTPWRQSQRERMLYLTSEKEGTQEVLLEKGNGEVEMKSFSVGIMNEKWFDVAATGGAVQCDPGECEIVAKEFNYADRVSPSEQKKYKYLMDMDGNGWSSRFRRLLTSASVIFKSTIFPEWNSELLIPWYHYVPVQVDYSDVYDIMAYFEGSPDGFTSGNDAKAEEIAAAGRRFTEERWRWEDMQSYMLLLMLEYSRAMADDRQAASFHS